MEYIRYDRDEEESENMEGGHPSERQGARGVSPQPLALPNLKEDYEMELQTNLAFWAPAMFFLGLVSMAVVYLFMDACEKI